LIPTDNSLATRPSGNGGPFLLSERTTDQVSNADTSFYVGFFDAFSPFRLAHFLTPDDDIFFIVYNML